jgi:signal transduction histidine kinase
MAAMPTAVLVADHAGRVTLANPQAAALFEVESPEDLQGLDLVRLLGEFRTAAAVDWADVLNGARAGQTAVAVPAQMPPSGDFVLQVAPLERAGPRRWVVTAADIAPVRQAQRQREEVLAFVSHDLRSPASAIVMLADLNLSGAVSTPHDDLLREIRRLAARTLAMSEDFVRTAQAETRPLARSALALAQLVEEGLADHRAQALAAGVPLEVAPVDAEVTVFVDRSLATRALGNLVSNGIKHSPSGAPVRVQARVQDDGLHLVVTDGGPGLSPEQLQHLAGGSEGAPVASVRGVGLGLLFVQRVARRHGGRLEAGAASPGPGARFELVLGLRPEADSGNP